MAQKKKILKQDKLVDKLAADPSQDPPNAIVLAGHLGNSSKEGYWRLYLSTELDEYAEIAEEDILGSESLETEKNPLGGTLLWIKRDAELQYKFISSKNVQAEFLKGEIASRFFGGGIAITTLQGGEGGLLQDTPPTVLKRTCIGAGHIVTNMNGSCPTQNGCTLLPECPVPPQPPKPPTPPQPPKPFIETEPWAVCTHNAFGRHVTRVYDPQWCPGRAE